MDKNPFLKYLIKESKEDIVHSSAYAQAQNEGSFGSTSTQSFDERRKIDANRKIVRKYNDSRLMQGTSSNAPRAKVYTPPAKTGVTGVGGVGGASQGRPTPQRINPGITRK